MNNKNIKIQSFLRVILLVILCSMVVKGQDISEITIQIPSFDTSGEKDKVNSKLDFNASDEDNITTTTRDKIGSGSNKSSPKIQGVRVTVDTGKGRKSAESGSKESVEIVENKNKKKIGIHTDITFEITDDSDDTNSTNSGQNDKDDPDASVPVYRGRGSSVTTHRPRRPYDPKTHYHWPGNQPPANHHHHHHNGGNNGRHYPVYPPRPNDEEIYPDGWSGFRPITSVWTTERSYYEPYRPNSVVGIYDNSANSPRWKPCYCASSEDRNRRSGYILVDDKLDRSFSSQGKKK